MKSILTYPIALSLSAFALVSSIWICAQVPEMGFFDVFYSIGLLVYLLVVGFTLLFVSWAYPKRLVVLSAPIVLLNLVLILLNRILVYD